MIALPRLDTFDLEMFQTVLSCDFKVGCTRAVVVSATVLIDGDVASNPNLHVAVIDDGDTMLGCQEDWAINRAVLLCTHPGVGTRYGSWAFANLTNNNRLGISQDVLACACPQESVSPSHKNSQTVTSVKHVPW